MKIQEPLIDKKELGNRTGFGTRTIDGLVRSKKIPVIRINRKTVRFNWQDVQQAMDSWVVKGV
jgi:excisionase family DNA binding protein